MKKYVAEFIGTFVLAFVSCGAAAVSGGVDGVLGILGIAVAFGLSIVAMAYSIGNISGCHINPAVSLAMLIVEIVLTCIFLIAILGVTSKESFSSVAGLVIGLTLTFVHIIGIPLTGTSVNPARSLGPAIFTGGEALSQVWVFIVGPFVGAAIAAVIWMFLSAEDGADK